MAQRRTVGIAAVLLLLVGGGLYTMKPSDRRITSYGAWAEDVYNISEMGRQADLIVTGTVTAVGEGRWATPDGEKPTTVTQDDIAGIHHRVTITVDRALKGRPGDTVTLRVNEGEVDDYTKLSSSAPEYRKGERVLVFIEEQDGHYVTRSAQFGTFAIGDGVIERPDAPPEYRQRINVTELVEQLAARYGAGT